jgi:hypothetical protein
MKKLNVISGIMLAAAAIVVGGVSTAQAQDRVDAKVPFAFVVNGEQLPAGSYEVRETSEGPDALTIVSSDGQKAVTMMTIPSTSTNNVGAPRLVFATINDQHVLVGVDLGEGESRRLLPDRSNADQAAETAAHGGNR